MITLEQDVVVLDWENASESGLPPKGAIGRGAIFVRCRNDKDQTNTYSIFLDWKDSDNKVFNALGLRKTAQEGGENGVPPTLREVATKNLTTKDAHARTAAQQTATAGQRTAAASPANEREVEWLARLNFERPGNLPAGWRIDPAAQAGKYPFEVVVIADKGDRGDRDREGRELAALERSALTSYEEFKRLRRERPECFQAFPATLVIPPFGDWNYALETLDARDKRSVDGSDKKEDRIHFKWWLRRASRIQAVFKNNRNDWLYCFLDLSKADTVYLNPFMERAIPPDAEDLHGLPGPIVAIPPARRGDKGAYEPGELRVPLLLHPRGKRKFRGQEDKPLLLNKFSALRVDAPATALATPQMAPTRTDGKPAAPAAPDVDAPVWARRGKEDTRQEPTRSPSVVYFPLLRMYKSPFETAKRWIMTALVLGVGLYLLACLYVKVVYRDLRAEPVESVTSDGRITLFGKLLSGAKVHVRSTDTAHEEQDVVVQQTLEGRKAHAKYAGKAKRDSVQKLVRGDNPIPELEETEGVIQIDYPRFRGQKVSLTVTRDLPLPFIASLVAHQCETAVEVKAPDQPAAATDARIAVGMGRKGAGNAAIGNGAQAATKPTGNGNKNPAVTPVTPPNIGSTPTPPISDPPPKPVTPSRPVIKPTPGATPEQLAAQKRLTELKQWCDLMKTPLLYPVLQGAHTAATPLGLQLGVVFSKVAHEDGAAPADQSGYEANFTISASKPCYAQLYSFPSGARRALLGKLPDGKAIFDPLNMAKNSSTGGAYEIALAGEELPKNGFTDEIGSPESVEYVVIAVAADKLPSDPKEKDAALKNLIEFLKSQKQPTSDWAVTGWKGKPQ